MLIRRWGNDQCSATTNVGSHSPDPPSDIPPTVTAGSIYLLSSDNLPPRPLAASGARHYRPREQAWVKDPTDALPMGRKIGKKLSDLSWLIYLFVTRMRTF